MSLNWDDMDFVTVVLVLTLLAFLIGMFFGAIGGQYVGENMCLKKQLYREASDED